MTDRSFSQSRLALMSVRPNKAAEEVMRADKKKTNPQMLMNAVKKRRENLLRSADAYLQHISYKSDHKFGIFDQTREHI